MSSSFVKYRSLISLLSLLSISALTQSRDLGIDRIGLLLDVSDHNGDGLLTDSEFQNTNYQLSVQEEWQAFKQTLPQALQTKVMNEGLTLQELRQSAIGSSGKRNFQVIFIVMFSLATGFITFLYRVSRKSKY